VGLGLVAPDAALGQRATPGAGESFEQRACSGFATTLGGGAPLDENRSARSDVVTAWRSKNE
jgi:hypothetical protein